MLRSLLLENFKCFRRTKEIPLHQINVLYGKNGRGKSTVIQALLLLAQTMKQNNDISSLILVGELIKLGMFEDIKNKQTKDSFFRMNVHGDENVEMTYSEYPNKPQLALIRSLCVNGQNRLDVNSELDLKGDEKNDKTVGATSDIITLQELKSISYVAADRFGPVNSIIRQDTLSDGFLGVRGEYLINVLSSKGMSFLERVESELSMILSGASMRINYKDSEIIELFLNSVDGKTTYRPVNVGFGYSYVLPVIVSALLASEGSLLIVENPEAHLHPGAQSRLMKFLVRISKEKNLQLLVESHSDHVVNGLRIATREGMLKADDSLILYFDHSTDCEEPDIHYIHCDYKGELDDYPVDFMDEWTNQMLELLKVQHV